MALNRSQRDRLTMAGFDHGARGDDSAKLDQVRVHREFDIPGGAFNADGNEAYSIYLRAFLHGADVRKQEIEQRGKMPPGPLPEERREPVDEVFESKRGRVTVTPRFSDDGLWLEGHDIVGVPLQPISRTTSVTAEGYNEFTAYLPWDSYMASSGCYDTAAVRKFAERALKTYS